MLPTACKTECVYNCSKFLGLQVCSHVSTCSVQCQRWLMHLVPHYMSLNPQRSSQFSCSSYDAMSRSNLAPKTKKQRWQNHLGFAAKPHLTLHTYCEHKTNMYNLRYNYCAKQLHKSKIFYILCHSLIKANIRIKYRGPPKHYQLEIHLQNDTFRPQMGVMSPQFNCMSTLMPPKFVQTKHSHTTVKSLTTCMYICCVCVCVWPIYYY